MSPGVAFWLWVAAAVVLTVGWGLGRRTSTAHIGVLEQTIANRDETIALLQKRLDRCTCQPRHPSTGRLHLVTRNTAGVYDHTQDDPWGGDGA